MNIKNLKVGMQFKNYKALCEFLGIEVKQGGRNKNLQLEELSRYFSYEKQGQKFIIKEVYDMPKPKIEKRGGSNNNITYTEYIEKLILDLLVQNLHKEKVCLSKNQLYKELKMINGNYTFCKERIPKLSKFMGINEDTIEEFYEATDSTLKGNLEKSLNNLKKQSLIFWSNEISVCKIDVMNNDIYNIDKKVTLDQYNEEIVEFRVNAGYTYNFRESTEEEKKFILQAEREVMDKMGFDNKQIIVQCGMWIEFKNKVNAIVLQELNINFYFDSYKILFNQQHIYKKYEELLDLLLTKDEREKHQTELNKAVMERIHGNIEKKQVRALDETKNCIGEFKDDKLKRRTNDSYVEDNEKLINTLIDKNSKDIKKTIKRIKIDKIGTNENPI